MRKNVVEVCERGWVPDISWNNPDDFNLPCVKDFPLLTEVRGDFIGGIESWIEVMILNEVLNRGLLLEKGDTIYIPVDSYVDSFNFEVRVQEDKESLGKEITLRVRDDLNKGMLTAVVTVIDCPKCEYEVGSYDGGPEKLTLSNYHLSVDLSLE